MVLVDPGASAVALDGRIRARAELQDLGRRRGGPDACGAGEEGAPAGRGDTGHRVAGAHRRRARNGGDLAAPVEQCRGALRIDASDARRRGPVAQGAAAGPDGRDTRRVGDVGDVPFRRGEAGRLEGAGWHQRQDQGALVPAHRPQRRPELSLGRRGGVDVGVMPTAVQVFDVKPKADRGGT